MFPMRGRGGRGRGRASSYNITNKPTREQESTTSKTIIKPSSSQNLVKDEYLHSDVISINLALDLQTEAWFTNLRNTWSKCKKNRLKKINFNVIPNCNANSALLVSIKYSQKILFLPKICHYNVST